MDVKTSDRDLDHETTVTKPFVATSFAKGVRSNSLPVASLYLNVRMERSIASFKRKCLGKFLLFGQRDVDHVGSELEEYYDNPRLRMGRTQLPPVREKSE